MFDKIIYEFHKNIQWKAIPYFFVMSTEDFVIMTGIPIDVAQEYAEEIIQQ